MTSFNRYRRTQIAELRPYKEGESIGSISISAEDAAMGSPKPGDMIARNPANHNDQWLVSAKYFADNFDTLDAPDKKETSARVSSIASDYVNITIAEIFDEDKLTDQERDEATKLVADIQTLAGSALSQDETPSQYIPKEAREIRPATFLDRLKSEHQELGKKLDGLTKFIGVDMPGASQYQRDLLTIQHGIMTLYHRVLQQRLTDLLITGDADKGE